ncbi:MAG: LamG-like jellyroll fold domain-containing protein [Bacteroidota bacterium]|nr:LamG-like jellyroll fold domain-containing protein [Bacteroidota bacterium]
MKNYYKLSLGMLFVCLQLSAQVTNSGLIVSYPFNGNANNEVSNKNNGYVLYASATTDQLGNANSAFLFHGYYDERIECGDDPIGDDESVTIFASIYPTTPLHDGYQNSENQYIISTGGQSGSIGHFILWNNGKIRGGRKTSTNICDTLFGSYKPYNWYKIAFTYDQSTRLYNFYVNDSLVISSYAKTGYNLTHVFKTMTIGAPNTPYYGNFVGKIDDIKIYNRALSYTEVTGKTPDIPTGIDNTNLKNTRVFPNPASDRIFVDFENTVKIENSSIRLINSLGQIVYSSPISSTNLSIDLKSIPSKGAHILQVVDGNHSVIFNKKVFLR